MSNFMKGYSWSTPRYARDVAQEIGELILKNQDDVKITGMAIAETFFNGKLYPIRAEIEVGLQVLGDAEARDNTRVRSSLELTGANRRKMARLYLDTTADQGTSINLPQ